MIKVAVIGYGNVAYHLIEHLADSPKINLAFIYSRTTKIDRELPPGCKLTASLEDIRDVDLAIIAVTDDAIAAVSCQLNVPLVVHTSGAVPMNALQNTTSKGVFYPLQSFSKVKPVRFSEIPICIESEHKSDRVLLKQLAAILGAQTYAITSEQRTYLHVAAVFANNFSNHMYAIAHEICNAHKVPFEVLQPLIQETAAKVAVLEPKKAQTGPAIRKDEKTLAKHLHLLDTNEQEIYRLLTKSIQNYGN